MRLRRDAIIAMIGIAGLSGSCEHKGLTPTASAGEAREIYRVGESYGTPAETLARAGYLPTRRPGQRGCTLHVV